jgi:cephalosporin-C deacetylase-like acetyl esterase
MKNFRGCLISPFQKRFQRRGVACGDRVGRALSTYAVAASDAPTDFIRQAHRNFTRGLARAMLAFLLMSTVVADELRVLSGDLPNGVQPEQMVESWMNQKLLASYEDWKEGFVRRQTEGGWEEHHRALRQSLIESIGGLPEKTPLNARVTGVIERPGFRVEKILFESRPGFFVTASLYLPDRARFSGLRPGVLIPSGHAKPAKAHDEYQSMGALLALNGFVGFVFDPLDQGERMQYRKDDGSMPYYGTHMHMQEGIVAMLLGEGLIQYFAWDGIRALDYLASRPEVDTNRLGISGNSGGGTQTSYIFALDDRLKAAAPSCWPHLANRQLKDSMGDMEQMNYGMLAMGLEHPSFFLMRAPAPVKILGATHDFFQIDAVWEGFRFIKRHYTDLGYSERADILENNTGHNYDQTQREAAVRWFDQWLNKNVSEIWEPELNLFSEEELRVTDTGQVMDLPGARSIFDLFNEKLELVRPGREKTWKAASERDRRNIVRKSVQVRRIDEIPVSSIIDKGESRRSGYIARKRLLETEEGICLPVIDTVPELPSSELPLLIVSSKGAGESLMEGGLGDTWAKSGRRVIAVDVRGVGETQQKSQTTQGSFFGTDQEDFAGAYLLGESYLGMRVEDILRTIRYVENSTGVSKGEIKLYAEGDIGVAALHAAFLEPEHVKQARIRGSLKSWESILENQRSYHQLANSVQGALLHYDLPHLETALGERLEVMMPVDSLGFENIIEGAEPPPGYDDPTQLGLVGTFFGNARFLNAQGEAALEKLTMDYDNSIERRGNDWSGIWFGYLVGPTTGTVTLVGESAQHISIAIDGDYALVLDDFPGTETASIQMEAGTVYPVEVRYQLPSGGVGSFDIKWEWEGQSRKTISRDFLRHTPRQESELKRTWR